MVPPQSFVGNIKMIQREIIGGLLLVNGILLLHKLLFNAVKALKHPLIPHCCSALMVSGKNHSASQIDHNLQCFLLTHVHALKQHTHVRGAFNV